MIPNGVSSKWACSRCWKVAASVNGRLIGSRVSMGKPLTGMFTGKYHLPPMIEVEWLDIAYRQEVRDQRLPPNTTILDYGQDIIDLLQRIGLEFEVGKKHVRIFGYAPRRRNLFDE